MNDIAGLLPLVLIVLVFYLLILRPAKARQKAALTLQSTLAAGQQVLTTSGLYATVVSVDADAVTLETSPGVRSRWARGAVSQIVSEPAGATSTEASASEAGADRPDAAHPESGPGRGDPLR